MTDLLNSGSSTTLSEREVVGTRTGGWSSLVSMSDVDVDVIVMRQPHAWWPAPSFGQPIEPVLPDQILALQWLQDDWDGYRAVAPTSAALSQTSRLLRAFSGVLPLPEVSPATDGGVLIEWEGGVEVLLRILPDGSIEAAIESDTIDAEGPLETVAEELSDALAQIATGI